MAIYADRYRSNVLLQQAKAPVGNTASMEKTSSAENTPVVKNEQVVNSAKPGRVVNAAEKYFHDVIGR